MLLKAEDQTKVSYTDVSDSDPCLLSMKGFTFHALGSQFKYIES